MTTQILRLTRFGMPVFVWAFTMGVANSAPFTLISAPPKTLTEKAVTVDQHQQTIGKTSPDKKTLTFAQKTIRLVVTTGPENDMLSYRIGSLRNPTLIVPKGTLLKLLFVNTDDDMFHDIRFGMPQKSYPNRMESYLKISVGTPPLPHRSETALHGEELTLRAPKASEHYVYLCTVRGHAQGGMVGTIIVR